MDNFKQNSIIIKQICTSIEPGKKMLQKLMYLIDRKDVNLALNYSIHFYGPYSAKLDNTLHRLESYDMVRIDTNRSTHTIHLGDVSIDGVLEKAIQEKVDFVLKNFSSKTALELEAITTVDYVATVLLKGSASDEQVIERVKLIKGSKFTSEYLQDSLEILKKYDYYQGNKNI